MLDAMFGFEEAACTQQFLRSSTAAYNIIDA